MSDRPDPNSINGGVILTCDMVKGCTEVVTHIDEKGYIYCRTHGRERKSYKRCRQLTGAELRQLKTGNPLGVY